MSMSRSPIARSVATVARPPFTEQRLRPPASAVRRTSSSPSSTGASASSPSSPESSGAELEQPGDGRASLGAQPVGAGSRAEQQLERGENERLADAGGAGDHVEAGGQIEVGLADQREVADLEAREHRRLR
jgi:hypothetical protein